MARSVLLHQHGNMLSSLKVHKKKKHAKNPIKTDTFVKNTTFKARKYGNKTLKQSGGNYKRVSSSRGVESSRSVMSRIAADAAAKRDAIAQRIEIALKLAKGNLGGLTNRKLKQPTNPSKRDLGDAQRKATLETLLKESESVAAKRNPQPPQRVENPVSLSMFPSPVHYTDVQNQLARAALDKFKLEQIAQQAKADGVAVLRREQIARAAQVFALKIQDAAANNRKVMLITDATSNLVTGRQNLETYTTTFVSGRTTYLTSKVTRVELQTVVTTITENINGITTQVQKNVITAFLSADKIATEITNIQSIISLETRQLNDATLNLSELPAAEPSRDVSQEMSNYEAAALALNTFAFTTPNPALKQKVLTDISNIVESATREIRDKLDTLGDIFSILSRQLEGARTTVASIPGQKQAAIAGWVTQFETLQTNLLSASDRSEYSRVISDYSARQSRNTELLATIDAFVPAALPPGKNIYPDSKNKDDAYSVYTETVETSMRITFLTPDPMPIEGVSRIDISEVGLLQNVIRDESVKVLNSLEAATNSAVFIKGASDNTAAAYNVLNGIAVVPRPLHSMVDGITTTVTTKTLENTQTNATLTGGAFNLLRELAVTQGAESQGNQVAATGQKLTGRRLAQDLKGGIFAPVAKQTAALTPVKDALTTLLNTTENVAEQKLNAQILSDTFGNIVNIYSRLTGSSSRSPTLQTELTIRLNAEIIKFRDTLQSNTDSYILFLQKTSPSALNLFDMPTSIDRNNASAVLLDVVTKIDNLQKQTTLLTGRFTSILFQANKLLTVRSIRDLQVSIFSSKVLSSCRDSVNYKNAVASSFSARKLTQATVQLFKADSTVDTARRSVGLVAGSFKINNARIKRNAADIGSKTAALSAIRFESLVLFSSAQLGIIGITKIVKHRPIDVMFGMIAGNATLIASVISRGPYNNKEVLTFPIESTDAQSIVNRMNLEILGLTDDNSSRLTANMVRRLEIGELPLLGRRKGLSADLILTATRSSSTTITVRNTKRIARAMRAESGIRLFNAKNSNNVNPALLRIYGIRANVTTVTTKRGIVTTKMSEINGLTTTKAIEFRTKTELVLFQSIATGIKNVFTLKQNESYTPRNAAYNTALSQTRVRNDYIITILSLRDDVVSRIFAIGTPVLTPRTLESMPLSPDVSFLTDALKTRRELNEYNTQLEKARAVYMLELTDLQKLENLPLRSSNVLLKKIASNTFFTRIMNHIMKIGMAKLRETTNTVLKAFKSTDNSRVIKNTSSVTAGNVLTVANKNAELSGKVALKNATLVVKDGEVRKGSQLTQGKSFVNTLKGLFSLKADAKVAPINSGRNTTQSRLTKNAENILKVTASVVSLVLAIGGIDIDVSRITDIIAILPNLPNMSILDTARAGLKLLQNSNSRLLNYIAAARKEISEIGNLLVKAARKPRDVLSSIYGAKTAWRAIKFSVGKSRDAIVTVFKGLKAFDTSAVIKGIVFATQIGTFNVNSKNSILQNTIYTLANYQIIKTNINNLGNALVFSAFMFGKLRTALFGDRNAKVVPINSARNAHAAGINKYNDALLLVNTLKANNSSNILDVGTPVPPQTLQPSPTLPNTSVLNNARLMLASLWNSTTRFASLVARHFREMNEIKKLDTQRSRPLTTMLPLIHGAQTAYRAIKKELGKGKPAIKARFDALKGSNTSLSIKNLFSTGKVNTYEIETKTKLIEGITAEKDAAVVVKAAEVRKATQLRQGKGLITILKGFLFKENAKVVPINPARNAHSVGINKYNDAILLVNTLKANNSSNILDVGTPVPPQTLQPSPTVPNTSILDTAKALSISLRERGTQLVNFLARHLREIGETKKLDTTRGRTLISMLPSIYGAKAAYRSIKKEVGKAKAAIKARFDALKGTNTSLSIKNLFSTDKVNVYEIETKTKLIEGITAEKTAAVVVKAAEVRKATQLRQGKGLITILKGFLFKENAKVVPINSARNAHAAGINKYNDAILLVNTLKANNSSNILDVGTPVPPQTLQPSPTVPNTSILDTAKEAIQSLYKSSSRLLDFITRGRKEISEIGKLEVRAARNVKGVLSSIYGAKTAWRAIKYGMVNAKVAMKGAFNRLKALDTSAIVKGFASTYKGDSLNVTSKQSTLQTLLGTLTNYSTLKSQMIRLGRSLNTFLGLFRNLRNTLFINQSAKVVPIDSAYNGRTVAINKNNDGIKLVKQLESDNNSKLVDLGTPVPPQILDSPPTFPNTSVLNNAKLTLILLSNRIGQLVSSISISSRKIFEISKFAIKSPRILMAAIISISKIKNANNQLKNATANRKESDTSALAVLKENSDVDAINGTVSDTTAKTNAINTKKGSIKDTTAALGAEVKNKTTLGFTKLSLVTFNSIQSGLKTVLFGNPDSNHVTKTSNRNRILLQMLGNRDKTKGQYDLIDYLLGKIGIVGTPKLPTESAGDKPRQPDNLELENTKKIINDVRKMNDTLAYFNALMTKQIADIKRLGSILNNRGAKTLRDVIGMLTLIKNVFSLNKKKSMELRQPVERYTLSEVQNTISEIAAKLAQIKGKLDDVRNRDDARTNTKAIKEGEIVKGSALSTVKTLISNLRALLSSKVNEAHMPSSTLAKKISAHKSLVAVFSNKLLGVKNTLLSGISRLALGIRRPANVPNKPRQTDTSQLADAQLLRDSLEKMNERLAALNALMNKEMPEVKLLESMVNNRSAKGLRNVVRVLVTSKRGFKALKMNARQLNEAVRRNTLSEIETSNRDILLTIADIKNKLKEIGELQSARALETAAKQRDGSTRGMLDVFRRLASDLRTKLFGRDTDSHVTTTRLNKDMNTQRLLLEDSVNTLMSVNKTVESAAKRLQLGLRTPGRLGNKPRELDVSQLETAKKARDDLSKSNRELVALNDARNKQRLEVGKLSAVVPIRKRLSTILGNINNTKQNYKTLKNSVHKRAPLETDKDKTNIETLNKEIAGKLAEIKNKLDELANAQNALDNNTDSKEADVSKQQMLNTVKTFISNLRGLLSGKPNDVHTPTSKLAKDLTTHKSLLQVFFNKLTTVKNTLVSGISRLALGIRRPVNLPKKPAEIDTSQLTDAQALRDSLERMNIRLAALEALMTKKIPDVRKLESLLNTRDTSPLQKIFGMLFTSKRGFKAYKENAHSLKKAIERKSLSDILNMNREIAAKLAEIKNKLDDISNTEDALTNTQRNKEGERVKGTALSIVKNFISNLRGLLSGKPNDVHTPTSKLAKDLTTHKSLLQVFSNNLIRVKNTLVSGISRLALGIRRPDNVSNKPNQADTPQLRDAQALRDSLERMNIRLAALDALLIKQIPDVRKLESLLNTRDPSPLQKISGMLFTSKRGFKAYKEKARLLKGLATRDSLSDILNSNREIAGKLAEIKNKLDDIRNTQDTLTNTQRNKEGETVKGIALNTVKNFISNLRGLLSGKPNDVHTPTSKLAKDLTTHKSLLQVFSNNLIRVKNTLVAGISRLALAIRRPDNVPSKPREADTSQLTDAQALRNTLEKINTRLKGFYDIMNKQIPELKLLESILDNRGAKGLRDVVRMLVTSKKGFKAYKEQAGLLNQPFARDTLFDIQNSNREIAGKLAEIKSKLEQIGELQATRTFEIVTKERERSTRGMLDLFTRLASDLRTKLFGRPTDSHVSASRLHKAIKQHQTLLDSTVNKLELAISDIVNATDNIQSGLKIPDNLPNKPRNLDTSQLTNAQKLRDALKKMNDTLNAFDALLTKQIPEIKNLGSALKNRDTNVLQRLLTMLSGSKKGFKVYKENARSANQTLTRKSLSDILNMNKEIAGKLAEIKNKLDDIRNTQDMLTNTQRNREGEIVNGTKLNTVKTFISNLRALLSGKPNDVHMATSKLAKDLTTHKSLLQVFSNKVTTVKNTLVSGITRLALGIRRPDNVPSKPREADTSQLRDAQALRDTLKEINTRLEAFDALLNRQIPEIKTLGSALKSRDTNVLETLLTMLSGSKSGISALKRNARQVNQRAIRKSLSDIQRSNKEIADTIAEIKRKLDDIRNTDDALTNTRRNKESELSNYRMLDTVKGFVSNLRNLLSGKPNDIYMPSSTLTKSTARHKSLLELFSSKLVEANNTLIAGISRLALGIRRPDNVPSKPRETDTSQLTNAQALRNTLRNINDRLRAFYDIMTKQIQEVTVLGSKLYTRGANGLTTVVGILLRFKTGFKAYKEQAHLVKAPITRDSLSDIDRSKREIANTADAIKGKLDDIDGLTNDVASETLRKKGEISKHRMLDLFTNLTSNLRALLQTKMNDPSMPRSALNNGMNKHNILLKGFFNMVSLANSSIINGIRRTILGLKRPDNLPNKPIELDTSQLDNAKKLRDELLRLNENLTALKAERNKEIPDIEKLSDTLRRRDTIGETIVKIHDTIKMYKALKDSISERSTPDKLSDKSEIEATNKEIADTLNTIKETLDTLTNTENALDTKTAEHNAERSKREMLQNVEGLVSQLHTILLVNQADPHVSKSTLNKSMDAHSRKLESTIKQLELAITDLVNGAESIESGLKIPDNLGTKPNQPDFSQLANAQKLVDTLIDTNNRLTLLNELMAEKIPDIENLASVLNTRYSNPLTKLVSMLFISKKGFKAYKEKARPLNQALTRKSLSDIQNTNSKIAAKLAEIKNKLDELRNTEDALTNTKRNKEGEIVKGIALDNVKTLVSNLRELLDGKPNDVHMPSSTLAKDLTTHKSLLQVFSSKLVQAKNTLIAGISRLALGIRRPDNVPSKPRETDTSQLTNAQALRNTLRNINDRLRAFYDIMTKQIQEVSLLASKLYTRGANGLNTLVGILLQFKTGFKAYKEQAHLVKAPITRDSLSDIDRSKREIADTADAIKGKLDEIDGLTNDVASETLRKKAEISTHGMLDLFKGLASDLRTKLFGKPTDSHVSASKLNNSMKQHQNLLDSVVNKLESAIGDLVNAIDNIESALKIPDNIPNKPREPDTSQLRDAEKLRDDLRKMNDMLDAFDALLTKQIPELKNLESMLNTRSANSLREALTMFSGAKTVFNAYKENARSLNKALTRDSLADVEKSNKEIADTLSEIKKKLDELRNTEDALTNTKEVKKGEIVNGRKLNTVKTFILNLRALLSGKPNDIHMPSSKVAKDLTAHKSLIQIFSNKLITAKNTLVSGITRLALGIRRPDNVPNKPREADTSQLANAQALRDSLQRMNDTLAAFDALMNKKIPELKLLESTLNKREAQTLRELISMLVVSKTALKYFKDRSLGVRKAITRDSLSDIQKSNKEIAKTLDEIKGKLKDISDLQDARTGETVRKEGEMLTHEMLDVFAALTPELRDTLTTKETDSHVPKGALNQGMKQHESILIDTVSKVESVLKDLVDSIANIESGLKTPDNLPNKPSEMDTSQLDNAKKLRDELSRLNEELSALNAERNKEIPDIENLSDTLTVRDKLSTLLGKIFETGRTYKTLKDSAHERSTPDKVTDKSEIEATNKEIADTLDTIKETLDTLTNTENALDTKTAEYNAERSKREMLQNVEGLVSQLHTILLANQADPHLPKSTLNKSMDAHSRNLESSIKQLESLMADIVNGAEGIQSALKTPDNLGTKPIEPDTSQVRDAEKLRDSLIEINSKLDAFNDIMNKQMLDIGTLETVLNGRDRLRGLFGMLAGYKNAFKAYKTQIHLLNNGVTRDNASDIDATNKKIANTLDAINDRLDTLANTKDARDNKTADKKTEGLRNTTLSLVKNFVLGLRSILRGRPSDPRIPRSLVNDGMQQHKSVLDAILNTVRSAINTVVDGINNMVLVLKKPDTLQNKPREPDNSELRDAEKQRDDLRKMNDRLDALNAIFAKKIPDIETLMAVLSDRSRLGEAFGMLSSYKDAFNAYKTQLYLSREDIIRDNASDIKRINKETMDNISKINEALTRLTEMENARDTNNQLFGNETTRSAMLKEARDIVASLHNDLLKLTSEKTGVRTLQRNTLDLALAETDSSIRDLQKDQSDVENGIDDIGNPEPPTRELSDEPTLPDNSDLIEAQRLRDSLDKINRDLSQLIDMHRKNIDEIGNLEDVSAMRKKLNDTIETLANLKKLYKSQKDSVHKRSEFTRDNLSDIDTLVKEIAKTLPEIKDKLNRLAEAEQALNDANKNRDAELLTLRMLQDTQDAVSLLKDTLIERGFDPTDAIKFRRDTTQSKLDKLAEDIANVTTKQTEADTAVNDMGTPEPSRAQPYDMPTKPDTSDLDAAKNLRDRLTEASDRLLQILEVSKSLSTDIEGLHNKLSRRLEISKLIEFVTKEKLLWKSLKGEMYRNRKDLSRDNIDSINAIKKSINDTFKSINDKIDALRKAENNLDVLTKDKDGNTNTREMIQAARDAINKLRESLLGDPSDLHTERKGDRNRLEANLKRLESDIAKLEAAMLKLDDSINETNPKEPTDKNPGDKPMLPDDSALKLAKDIRNMLEINNGLLHDRSKSLRDISDHIDTIRESIALRIEEINTLRQAIEQSSNKRFKEKQDAIDARRKAEKEAKRLKEEDLRKKRDEQELIKRRLPDLDPFTKRKDEAAKKLKDEQNAKKKKQDENDRLKRQKEALLRALQSITLVNTTPALGLPPSLLAGILGGIGAAGLGPSIFSGATPPSSSQQPPDADDPGTGSADGQADGTAAGTADGTNRGREEARRQYDTWRIEQQNAELASTADEIEATAQEESNANNANDPEVNANNSGEPAANENYPINRRA